MDPITLCFVLVAFVALCKGADDFASWALKHGIQLIRSQNTRRRSGELHQ